MLFGKNFLTTTGASAVVGGVAIVKTGLPAYGKSAIILYPGRSGDVRFQYSSGVLANGKYFIVPADAGGNDPLVLEFKSFSDLPTHIAGDIGTVSVTYTVVVG